MTSRKLQYAPPNRKPKQAWLESLSSVENQKLGLVDLHPDIFGTFPRLIFHKFLYDRVKTILSPSLRPTCSLRDDFAVLNFAFQAIYIISLVHIIK